MKRVATMAAFLLLVAVVAMGDDGAKAAGSYPLTVTDDLGRMVTLAARPERVVSLAPSNTEILFAVGAGGQVVGVTTYCNYPKEAVGRATIGGFSAKSISVEKIVSLRPDVVFAYGKQQQQVIEALERAGIKVVVLSPRSVGDVYTEIRLAGMLTAHQAEAAAVVERMRGRIEAVAARVATVPQDRRVAVFWEVFDAPLMTAGPGTLTGQMLVLAGGLNVFADLSADYPQVSTEELVARDPAAIMGPDSHGDKLTAEQIAARPGWGGMDAVKKRRVYLINGDIASRGGPRIADAVEAMARALYPDLFR